MEPGDIPNAVVRIEVYKNPASGGFGIKLNTVGILDLPSTVEVLAAARGLVELQMGQEESADD